MKKLIFTLCLATSMVFLGGFAKANVDDFTINNFDAEYVISNDKVGGSMITSEVLEVTFTDQNHGIFRSIPKQHRGYDTKLKINSIERDGNKEKYETSVQNNNLVLKIGDPNRTITGKHTYKIVYYQERIINFEEGQQFYWDVNGNDWAQPFEKVSAKVTLKNGNFSSPGTVCFTGKQGSTSKDCQSGLNDTTATVQTTKSLLPLEGLTIGLNIEGTTFTQPTLADKFKDNLLNILGLSSGVLLAGLSGRYWRRHGKDFKGKGTIVPEYEPPNDLSPAEVGMLADYRVDGKDLSATLIDLAVRGYVKIHQETKKFLFAKTQNFSLELLVTDTSGLKAHEKALLNGVFSNMTVGEIIEIKKINRTNMMSAVQSTNKDVKNSLIKTYGLIDEKADKSMGWMLAIGFIGIFAGAFMGFLPNGFQAGIIGAAIVTLLLGFAMQRRTHAGVEIYEKIEGLKMYMNVAEKDRLKMMQSVDRPYAEPKKTVDLFEKLLPFAVALGVEKSWSKQFDGILTSQPNWISSNTAAFSATNFASSIGGMSTSFSNSFESSSGASGGSSGGGGGGGGGGGW